MRIGFISDGSEKQIRFAAEHGFPSIEQTLFKDWEERIAPQEQRKGWLKKYGVELD